MPDHEENPGDARVNYDIEREKDALSAAHWQGWAARNLTVGGGSVHDGFRVDPDRLRETIRKFDGVLRNLDVAVRESDFTKIEAPATDEISLNVARNANTMHRNAVVYIKTWRHQVQEVRDALAQSLSTYTATEQANAGQRT